ncbi:hypothetical protein NEOKW01_1298 [Nematocida sp. AWRm80]|nr:hypothetical protein NEOKW01_1298 [Nematocida sp. AWRm80]
MPLFRKKANRSTQDKVHFKNHSKQDNYSREQRENKYSAYDTFRPRSPEIPLTRHNSISKEEAQQPHNRDTDYEEYNNGNDNSRYSNHTYHKDCHEQPNHTDHNCSNEHDRISENNDYDRIAPSEHYYNYISMPVPEIARSSRDPRGNINLRENSENRLNPIEDTEYINEPELRERMAVRDSINHHMHRREEQIRNYPEHIEHFDYNTDPGARHLYTQPDTIDLSIPMERWHMTLGEGIYIFLTNISVLIDRLRKRLSNPIVYLLIIFVLGIPGQTFLRYLLLGLIKQIGDGAGIYELEVRPMYMLYAIGTDMIIGGIQMLSIIMSYKYRNFLTITLPYITLVLLAVPVLGIIMFVHYNISKIVMNYLVFELALVMLVFFIIWSVFKTFHLRARTYFMMSLFYIGYLCTVYSIIRLGVHNNEDIMLYSSWLTIVYRCNYPEAASMDPPRVRNCDIKDMPTNKLLPIANLLVDEASMIKACALVSFVALQRWLFDTQLYLMKREAKTKHTLMFLRAIKMCIFVQMFVTLCYFCSFSLLVQKAKLIFNFHSRPKSVWNSVSSYITDFFS